MSPSSRRDFLSSTAARAAGAACTSLLAKTARAAAEPPAIQFGLVTYMWGADWELPTLLKNCKKTGVLGVELRTTHAHKVEPDLDDAGREKVRNQFAESGVTFVGIGSDERFDNPDPAKVKAAIEKTKQFIRLSHDIGGSGVKVKPDKFYDNVPHEKTIEQIGKALNELGEYATGFGQQIRLEVHGQCAELPTIKAIMDVAKDENVAVCWNSNPTDLKGDGLEKNFALVRKRFGQTVHVRELDTPDYPFQELMDLLVKTKYEGWMLLEASSKPEDRVAALAAQKKLFDQMLKKAAA
ncbi:MAG: sugar phosphate isomerase/epimerase [Planctomycetales bacterium]|nr:sugar phosphate isomerase/epimerase [Planctomycetales bacterium]